MISKYNGQLIGGDIPHTFTNLSCRSIVKQNNDIQAANPCIPASLRYPTLGFYGVLEKMNLCLIVQ